MKDSRLTQLVREGLLDMFRKKKEEPQTKQYFISSLPINAKAENFLKLDPSIKDEDKLKAFRSVWYRSNNETRNSLRTLLDQEPYSQLKDFVTQYDKEIKQYQDDIASGKIKSSISSKSSVGDYGDSDAGSSASRIAGMSGLFEEQLRIKFLAGVITEAEYKEQLNGKSKKRG